MVSIIFQLPQKSQIEYSQRESIMDNDKTIKLFISYSHEDPEDINMLIKHMAPLKNKGMIDIWYDNKIKAGQELQDEIDSRLELSDIICLLISPNFLMSNACLKEKKMHLS